MYMYLLQARRGDLFLLNQQIGRNVNILIDNGCLALKNKSNFWNNTQTIYDIQLVSIIRVD